MFDSKAGLGLLPADLELDPAGGLMAVFLSAVSDGSLSGYESIRALKACQRLASFFQAQVLEKMAAISDRIAETDSEMAFESAAAEIGAALHLTRRAADSDLALALDLKYRLPRIWEALASGDIDLGRVRVIVSGTSHLDETAARGVVEQILDRATRMTTGQLNALLRRVCIQTDPDDADRRFREAVDRRRVVLEPTTEGTAHLFGLDLPPDRAEAAMRRIADLASKPQNRRRDPHPRPDPRRRPLRPPRRTPFCSRWETGNRRHPRRLDHFDPPG